jgi:CHAT domain-containing protein
VLRRKGRSIDETADTVGKLRTSASPEDRSLLNELADVRARRSGLALGRAHAQDEASDHDDAARLALRAEEIEALLGLRDPRLHAQTLPITVDRVRDSVPADTALLEYVRFDGSEPWKHAPEAHYAVVVVRRDADPVFADLGLAAPIDDEMARFRRDVRDPSSSVEQEARRLGSTLVQPIIASLDGVKRVLVSPDAGLNLLPFAALADESNRPLVERYEISYLTSGRDLLRLGERAVRRGSAMVVAAPDFVASAEGAPGGGARGGPVDLHEARFHALPATVPEARSIGRMLDAVDVLTGIRATEAALKHAHGPRVLHVATHGFFVDEAGAGGAPVTGSSANPLLRSGIALAGANRRDGGDGEDGILTALEASGLDLWGTKLVVLSACDTGLGEVRAGEGVYGLRRAMVLAGSETQVMSLWDIDDRATRELMVAYYRGLLSGAGRAEAMRRVQLRMMKDPKRRHPAYWASFIVSGDWRPLD